MESVAESAHYFQRSIKLIFYTILSYLTYTYLLRPIFNALYPIYYYQRFHCLPRNFLLGNLRRIMPKFPFPSTLDEVARNTDAQFDEVVNTNKDRSISVLWFGLYPMVLISDHEAVEAVMSRSNLEKPFFYKFMISTNSLGTANPVQWKVRRKVIEPFFVTKKQRQFVKIMDEEIKSLPKLLTQWTGKPVEIEKPIFSTALNVILKVTASIPLNDLSETKEIMIDTIERMEKIIMNRVLNPLYWFESTLKFFKLGKIYFQEIDGYYSIMKTIFNRRKELLELNPPNKEDHDYIHNLEPHTDLDGLTDESALNIIAGHDTISVGLRWMFFTLGNHLDIQERLYQEIVDYFPDDEPVNDLDRLNQCTYLDQCLKESLRLFPPVPSVARVLAEDVMVKGKKLLKGTSVFICIKTTHRDPSVYPDPTKYDPERWSPENVEKIPNAAFIPFAYGPRNCIGFRYAMIIMKVYLVHVLRKFSLKSTQKETSIRTRSEMTFKPDSPLEIILSPRKNSGSTNNNVISD